MSTYIKMSTQGLNAPDKITDSQKITAGYFSDSVGKLIAAKIHSSSLTDTNEKYYFGITNTPSASGVTQFTVAYGDIHGSGSDDDLKDIKSPTEAIYKQWASTLLAENEVTGGFKISRGDGAYTAPTAAKVGITQNNYGGNIAGVDESVYVLVGKRARFKDRLNKKNWTLVLSGSTSQGGSTYGTSSLLFGTSGPTGSVDEIVIGGVSFTYVHSASLYSNSATQIFIDNDTHLGVPGLAIHANSTSSANSLREAINNSGSLHGLNISASNTITTTGMLMKLSGSIKGAYANYTITTASTAPSDNKFLTSFTDTMTGGTANVKATSFKLKTLSHGSLLNNSGSAGAMTSSANNTLLSGSSDNLRWEVSSRNNKKGTFTLLIRRGDDTVKRKQILETWNNISLDPNSKNYISRIIGDQVQTLRDSGTSDPFLQQSGSYPNKSKYVRVEVKRQTVDYLDENGNVRDNSITGSLPITGSGSYQGTFEKGSDGYVGFDALGNQKGTSVKTNFYHEIGSQSQGYALTSGADGTTAYTDALNLIKNQDEYDINLLMLPGIISNTHGTIAQKAIDICEDRGDTFLILDPVPYASALSVATTEAEARDTNYASMYWPWVQIQDAELNKLRWVPPGVVLPSVFAFNDKVAHPWFAPAGLNRGGIDVAVQAERKLTHANRDTLYESNMNPIATFPGQGVCVWGQKTLQKKASALDRVNVRRLMIRVKKFIASSSRFLVFEQNNTATRNRFLNIVNPFLEQVQSNSGLTAFKVVMDESNNTPDTIDRNIMYGQIFVQPTRTAEFIVLDFTIQPTGATFPE